MCRPREAGNKAEKQASLSTWWRLSGTGGRKYSLVLSLLFVVLLDLSEILGKENKGLNLKAREFFSFCFYLFLVFFIFLKLFFIFYIVVDFVIH